MEARQRAEEYLLQRELMRSLATGAVHEPWATHWAYPFRYYSVIRAADHFRAAALHDGVAPDPRLGAAIEHVRDRRQADGTWHQQLHHEGRAWCRIDVGPGAALAVADLSRPAGAALVGRRGGLSPTSSPR
ncbi:hypothetical protein ACH0CA_08450 [Kytococcus sedentarius]|uniref:hypothetical protein n=1 Tax=Kytococcus sedentarius TaxID=1276 RepID=UPI003879D18E